MTYYLWNRLVTLAERIGDALINYLKARAEYMTNYEEY